MSLDKAAVLKARVNFLKAGNLPPELAYEYAHQVAQGVLAGITTYEELGISAVEIKALVSQSETKVSPMAVVAEFQKLWLAHNTAIEKGNHDLAQALLRQIAPSFRAVKRLINRHEIKPQDLMPFSTGDFFLLTETLARLENAS